MNFNSKINVLIRLSVIKESDSGLSWYVRDPWGGGDQGRTPLLANFFLNKGEGFRFGPFRVRTPDFGQKSGVLPLETAKIPDFFRACGAF